MICVMSVMNGFGAVIEHMFSEFDPAYRITPAQGKVMHITPRQMQALRAIDGVEQVAGSLEEIGLVRYHDHQTPARLMGVDSLWRETCHIDSIITDGQFCVWDGAFERAVLGRGLANTLGMNAGFQEPIRIYIPHRKGSVNMLRPDKSFRTEPVFIAGVFAVNQIQYDDEVMLISLPLAQQLFEYDSTTVSALSVSLTADADAEAVRTAIQSVLGSHYVVANRYEQQADFFRILHIEKLLTMLLMCFILLIASFNIISSLTMLIIDKQQDIRILSSLGASDGQIRRIFLLEGWMISTLGAMIGLVLGVSLCLIQQHFGILKLGSGEDYVLSAYPVVVHTADVLITATVVLLLGWVAAWYPTRKITSFSTSTAL